MSNLSPKEKINIYKNLFKGRTDIFAAHWEKADKSVSGYSPVCLNEWKKGICIKQNKGKCKDCQNQKYPSLNEFYIEQHLRGRKTYGIYPLLDDNTSYFLAADFDGKSWQVDAKNFMDECATISLPAYLERSRSGNGGHVWLFFEERFPACKSRKIVFEILKQIKIIDLFDKDDSFDRLFPNQDCLTGKGIGNLIALPLQGEARKKENTIFLNPKNSFKPYENQWQVLSKLKKIPIELLDDVYDKLCKDGEYDNYANYSKLALILKEQVVINKNRLPKIVTNFLKDNLNFLNSDYIIKKRIGVSVYGLEKYFNLIQKINGSIAIPRGFLNKLKAFLRKNKIDFEFRDERIKLAPIKIESNLKLYQYQQMAVDTIIESENGILVAPPGSGKTIIGLNLVVRHKQPTLILVHKKQIFEQWIERIENFLNIPKREVGQLGAGKRMMSDKITVAMVQTLSRMENLNDIADNIGMVIVDECHHIPAKMFRNVITKFRPYFLYGLTATPERKNNDAKLIFIYLGEILYSIEMDFLKKKNSFQQISDNVKSAPKIIIHNTDLFVPFKISTDNFQILSKIMIFDSTRNRMIVNDIVDNIRRGLRALVLTERKEHVEVLSYYLKRDVEIVTLTGDLSAVQRKNKIKQIESGNFQIIIATGQLIGEGTDFPNLDVLFLVYPFSFSGKLTQYIGRIQRGENKEKLIYDYRDEKIEYLEKQFKNRLRYYKKKFGYVQK